MTPSKHARARPLLTGRGPRRCSSLRAGAGTAAAPPDTCRRRARPGLHPARPGRQAAHARRRQGQGRPAGLLPRRLHRRLHHRSPLAHRRPQGPQGAGRPGLRRQRPGPNRHKAFCTTRRHPVHAVGRHREDRRQSLRRPDSAGSHRQPRDLHHRRGRQGRLCGQSRQCPPPDLRRRLGHMAQSPSPARAHVRRSLEHAGRRLVPAPALPPRSPRPARWRHSASPRPPSRSPTPSPAQTPRLPPRLPGKAPPS